MVAFGVETVVDQLARSCGLDPIDFRLKNAAKEGTQTHFGPKLGPIGYIETLERAKAHPHLQEKLGPDQGRGVASGFWFTLGAETSATVNIGEDGTATLIFGTVDVTGGSRSAFAMIVAEDSVMFTHPEGDTLYGVGFESDIDLERFKIFSPFGIIREGI